MIQFPHQNVAAGALNFPAITAIAFSTSPTSVYRPKLSLKLLPA
jgi:hypothetical protein